MSKTYKIVGSGHLSDFVAYGTIYLVTDHNNVVYLTLDELPFGGKDSNVEFDIETGLYAPVFKAQSDILRIWENDIPHLQEDLIDAAV